MSILIRNAVLLTMDSQKEEDPLRGDLLVADGKIAAIGTDLDYPPDTQMIDGRDRLVTPGLVNAHLHSVAAFHRGRTDNLPLELAMLHLYPLVGLTPLSEEIVYLRTMLVGMEAVKSGVTCVIDDLLELPSQTIELLGAVFRGYEDVGIRASCSGHIIDRAYVDSLPYAEEVLPPDVLHEARRAKRPSVEDYLAFSREAIQHFHGKGRFRYVVAPSGPQRCTDELLTAAAELSAQHDLAYHIHVLESKGHVVTGRRLYGKSLLRHMHDLGVLTERTAIAHGVWFDDADIELVADAGASVIHPVISNLKTGAGVAPIQKMLAAGVNVGLGTDSIWSAGSARLFDVMHMAAVVHNASSPAYWTWLKADAIMRAATLGGAASARLGETTGSLEVGKEADIVLFDTTGYNFLPFNDPAKHLAYSENGSSVHTVLVGGEVVVRDRKLTKVDEEQILAKLREVAPAITTRLSDEEQLAQRTLEHYYAEINRRCNIEDVGLNRYIEAEDEWLDELASTRFA
jgi:5-methylthioadenosine/S-adenosylhomocysteine deaminase